MIYTPFKTEDLRCLDQHGATESHFIVPIHRFEDCAKIVESLRKMKV